MSLGGVSPGGPDEASAPAGSGATGASHGAEILREALRHAELRYVYPTRVERRFQCATHIPDLDALGCHSMIERLAPPAR